MPGWGKLVAGAVLGVAGTLYATNEEFRKRLPKKARDLPVTVRQRFEAATAAAREASARRRVEILHELETRSEEHAGRRVLETPPGTPPGIPTPRVAEEEPVARMEDV